MNSLHTFIFVTLIVTLPCCCANEVKTHSSNSTDILNCTQYVDPNNCKWKENVRKIFNITADQPCIFNCKYDPRANPVRLAVIQRSNFMKANVFISARQNSQIDSWTLPIIFPEHGPTQPYTTIEEMLCPPRHNETDHLFFRIETFSTEPVQVNINLSNPPYRLKLNETVKVKCTPVSPWYKLYEWNKDEEAVLVTAETVGKEGGKVCALLSLQDGQCPVDTDKKGIMAGTGRYQSFQERGGMVAKREKFPNGVFIVVLPLPEDFMCTGNEESIMNKTSRHKTTMLRILPHTTISKTYGIYLVTLLILIGLVSASTYVITVLITRNLSIENPHFVSDENEEEDPLCPAPDISTHQIPAEGIRREVRVGGVIYRGPSTISNNGQGVSNVFDAEIREEPENSPSLQSQGVHERLQAIMEGNANITENSSGDFLNLNVATLPTEDENHPNEIVNVTNQNNPWFVYWWKVWAEYKDRKPGSTLGDIGFQRNMLIVAVFMALPFSELLRSYLHVFAYQGSEDQCFYNSKCMTSFLIFTDFSRVFTNVGYIICGLCFMFILGHHRKMNWKISAAETLGVSRNYGLFMSLAIGLLIQGVMSSMYHMCPNPVTLRLDMMFMYVDTIVLIVGIWGLRHGGVAHHVYPTVGLVGIALLGAEMKEWLSAPLFWTFAGIIHLFLTCTIATMLWKFGTWSFSPVAMLSIWKDWKPIVQNLNQLNNTTTVSLLNYIRGTSGILMNILIFICCAALDLEVYIYILILCIGNMILYVINYMSLKILYREKGTFVSWCASGMAVFLWIVGVCFFFLQNTDTENTPSASRALNAECVLFGVFDYHDLWHIFSSLALFFTFVSILTVDDDLARRNPLKIPVF